MLLLFDAVVVSCISDTMLPIVAETRLVDASVALVISVPIVSIDFIQTEDCVVMFVQFRIINVVPQRMLYVFCCFNVVSLLLTCCCIEAFLECHCSSLRGPGLS